MTYKRINFLTQEEFNEEMFDAVRRFIKWDLDLERIEEVARPYANQHKSSLNDVGDGCYWIAATVPRTMATMGFSCRFQMQELKWGLNLRAWPVPKVKMLSI